MPEIDYFCPAPRTRRRDLTQSETSGVHCANCFNPYQRYLFQPIQCCHLSLGTDHAAALIEPYFSYLSGLVAIVAGCGNWKPARFLWRARLLEPLSAVHQSHVLLWWKGRAIVSCTHGRVVA